MTKQQQYLRYKWVDGDGVKIEADCQIYDVIGVAVVDRNTEGAFFIDMSKENYNGDELAGYLKDVLGDVQTSYNVSVAKISKEGE